MKRHIIFLMISLIASLGYASGPNFASESNVTQLPEITGGDIEKSKQQKENLIEELLGYDLQKLDEDENSRGLSGSQLISHLINLVNQRIFPSHLRDFESKILNDNADKDVFLDYRGVDSGCYQFRLFHKNKDEVITNSEWASSILTVPAKSLNNTNTGSSAVIAPSLQGSTMFIEGGIWNRLCDRGVASLTLESLYTRGWFGKWKKVPFDPSPNVEDVLDFSIYENSIKRYERILLKNINFLRNFNQLKMSSGELLKDLPVMNLESDQVGYWGSSLGAIVGSIIIGKDPSIKGAVLTVAGGNLPYVISVSGINIFKYTREAQMDILKLQNSKEYEKFLSKHLVTDPLDFVSSSDSNRVYMIIAKKDTSVPTRAQFELYEQMGRPDRSLISAGHVLTLIYTAWVGRESTDRAVDFIVDRLGQ